MALTDLLSVDHSKYACNVFINGQTLAAGYEIISIQVKQGYQYISSAHIAFKQLVDGAAGSGLAGALGDIASGAAGGSGGSSLPVAGAAVAIKAKLDFDEIVLFEGHLVKHKYKNSANGTRFYITAKNKIINMALSTSTEVFVKQSDKDIIDSIISKHGCNMTTLHLTNQFMVKHTQLVKNGLSDWDFINLRAEANGCYLFTEKDTVTIDKPTTESDPTKLIEAEYGQNLFELESEQDERRYQLEDELISFNLATLENEKTSEEDSSLSSGIGGLGAITGTNGASAVKGKNSSINYRSFNEMEAADLLNSATQLKTISRQHGLVHIRARLDAKPGGTLEIKGFTELANGKFIISSVMQDYSDGGFTTWLEFGLRHEPYAKRYNLNTGNQRPVVLNGLVTQLQDDPDNLYRIQVKIAGWENAQESLWARLSTSYAGDQYGMVMLPEIGDEVIVVFSGNDFDVPVVIGSAFSPKLPPHTTFKDDNHEKVFITRKGMKWSWNDEKGIHEISTASGNKIIISEDDKSVTIEDENANKIVMNNSEINMTGSKDIIIKANSNVKIEGAAVEITASANMKIKGATVAIN